MPVSRGDQAVRALLSRPPPATSQSGTDGRRPSTGRWSVNLCNSSFDTTLAVYTGPGVNSLTQVSANDQGCPGRDTSWSAFSAVGGTRTGLPCPATSRRPRESSTDSCSPRRPTTISPATRSRVQPSRSWRATRARRASPPSQITRALRAPVAVPRRSSPLERRGAVALVPARVLLSILACVSGGAGARVTESQEQRSHLVLALIGWVRGPRRLETLSRATTA